MKNASEFVKEKWRSSILRLHRVTPRTMLCAANKIVPVIANSSHIAELAWNSASTDQRIARHNTRLPSELALRAIKISLINISLAVFAWSHGQVLSHIAIHVDLEDPVTNLISFCFRHYVLFRQDDVIWWRDIGSIEVGVVSDRVGIGVFDSVVKINITIEKNEGSIVVLDFSIRFTSVDKSLIGTDQLRITQQRSGNLSVDSVKTIAFGFRLEQHQVSDHQIAHKFNKNSIFAISNSLFKILDKFLKHFS